jgi:hypothetical protein
MDDNVRSTYFTARLDKIYNIDFFFFFLLSRNIKQIYNNVIRKKKLRRQGKPIQM